MLVRDKKMMFTRYFQGVSPEEARAYALGFLAAQCGQAVVQATTATTGPIVAVVAWTTDCGSPLDGSPKDVVEAVLQNGLAELEHHGRLVHIGL